MEIKKRFYENKVDPSSNIYSQDVIWRQFNIKDWCRKLWIILSTRITGSKRILNICRNLNNSIIRNVSGLIWRHVNPNAVFFMSVISGWFVTRMRLNWVKIFKLRPSLPEGGFNEFRRFYCHIWPEKLRR